MVPHGLYRVLTLTMCMLAGTVSGDGSPPPTCTKINTQAQSFDNVELDGSTTEDELTIRYILGRGSVDYPLLPMVAADPPDGGACDTITYELIDPTGATVTPSGANSVHLTNSSGGPIRVWYDDQVWNHLTNGTKNYKLRGTMGADGPTKDQTITITFTRNCSPSGVAYTGGVQTLPTITYQVGIGPVSPNGIGNTVQYVQPQLTTNNDMLGCGFALSNAFIWQDYTDGGSSGDYVSSILSHDKSGNAFTLKSIVADTGIANYKFNDDGFGNGSPAKDCDLSDPATTQCVLNFVFWVKSGIGNNESLGNFATQQIIFKSECHLLDTTAAGYDKDWSQANLDIMAEGYQIREPGVDFYVTKISPYLPTSTIALNSQYTWDRCGVLTYQFVDDAGVVNLPAPDLSVLPDPNLAMPDVNWIHVEHPTDASVGPKLSIHTEIEELVVNKEDFKLTWTSHIQAYFPNYPTKVYLTDTPIEFTLRDQCLGYLLSPANITTTTIGSLKSISRPENPYFKIEKYLLTGLSSLTFTKQLYYKQDYNSMNSGCGRLMYDWNLAPWVGFPFIDLPELNMITFPLELAEFNDPLIDTEEMYTFMIQAEDRAVVGTHYLTVAVSLEDSPALPGVELEVPYEYSIEIVIYDCKVNRLYWPNYRYNDVEIPLYLGVTEKQLNFRVPWQMPACGYEQWYTITVMEKADLEAETVDFDEDIENQNIGLPPLVTLDEDESKIYISAMDTGLTGRTFDVFLRYHVAVNETVQGPFVETLRPFAIQILGEARPPFDPNMGPRINEFVSSVEVRAGKKLKLSAGQPFDAEEDDFFVRSVEVDIEAAKDWFVFNNETSQTSLDFTFNVPPGNEGRSFEIKLVLEDAKGEKTKESIKVLVSEEVLTTFVPDFDYLDEKGEDTQEIAKDTITVRIEEPTNTGRVDFIFSDYVRMPDSVLDWTSDNEGGKHLDIAYIPNLETETILEDYEVDQEFKWVVIDVDIRSSPLRRVLQEEQDLASNESQVSLSLNATDFSANATNTTDAEESFKLIYIRRISVQMMWSDPIYVSQNTERDQVTVTIGNETFAYDPTVDVQSPDQQYQLKGKVSQQISESEEAAIQTIEDTAGGFLKVFMGSNFLLSIFLVGVLQFLWGMINTLQMIVLTVLFSVHMPSNCYRAMIAIMKLTNLDIIDIEAFLNSIFTFSAESGPLNPVFEEAGYDSSNFIIELGPLFLIICGSVAFYITRYFLVRSLRNCGDNFITRRLRKRLMLIAIIVRFLIEGCIELGLVAMIATRKISYERFEYVQDGTAAVFGIMMLACLGIAPFYLLYVGNKLTKNASELTDRQKASYNALFEAQRTDDGGSAVKFSAMFFFRRFVMIFMLVLLPSQRNIQIVTQLWSTLYIMSYTAYVLPYKSMTQNYQEILNEITVLVAAYHLFCFTEWIFDYHRRFELGWSLIGIIILNVIINVVIVCFVVLKSVCKKLYWMYLARVKARNMLAYMQRKSRREQHLYMGLEKRAQEEKRLKTIPEEDSLSFISLADAPLLIAAKTKPLKNYVNSKVYQSDKGGPVRESKFLSVVNDVATMQRKIDLARQDAVYLPTVQRYTGISGPLIRPTPSAYPSQEGLIPLRAPPTSLTGALDGGIPISEAADSQDRQVMKSKLTLLKNKVNNGHLSLLQQAQRPNNCGITLKPAAQSVLTSQTPSDVGAVSRMSADYDDGVPNRLSTPDGTSTREATVVFKTPATVKDSEEGTPNYSVMR